MAATPQNASRAAVEGLANVTEGLAASFDSRHPVSESLQTWAYNAHRHHEPVGAPFAIGFKWMAKAQGLPEALDDWLVPVAADRGVKFIFLERRNILRRAVSKHFQNLRTVQHVPNLPNAHTRDPKERDRLASIRAEMPTGDMLLRHLDNLSKDLEKLRALRDAVNASGLPLRVFAYESLDQTRLDAARDWILGDLADESRCTLTNGSSVLKVHGGKVRDSISNFAAVQATLNGTQYERYLED